MTSPSPGPNDENPDRTPRPGQQDYAYGRLYGRAPGSGGSGGSGRGPSQTLRTVYTFVLVWATTALIMWYGSRLLGFGRGDIGAAVVSFVVSLVAAIIITAWARNRRR